MKSKYELQMDDLNATVVTCEAQIAILQVKQAALVALINEATPALKQAAVSLHTTLCIFAHDGISPSCSWKSIENYDDPALADFTESAHSSWLERAKGGIAQLRELGFTITEPA